MIICNRSKEYLHNALWFMSNHDKEGSTPSSAVGDSHYKNRLGDGNMINNTNIKVPKKYHHMISEINYDAETGYVVILEKGFLVPGAKAHEIHETSQKAVLDAIRKIEVETYEFLDDNITYIDQDGENTVECHNDSEVVADAEYKVFHGYHVYKNGDIINPLTEKKIAHQIREWDNRLMVSLHINLKEPKIEISERTGKEKIVTKQSRKLSLARIVYECFGENFSHEDHDKIICAKDGNTHNVNFDNLVMYDITHSM